MIRNILLALLLVGIASATACTSTTSPVCAYLNVTNATTLPNEAYALSLNYTISHCGICYCTDQTSSVCATNGVTYANESLAVAASTVNVTVIALHCGPCSGLSSAYYNCAANYTQYGNFSNQSGSTLERYLTCGFRSAIGGGTNKASVAGIPAAQLADVFLAMLIVGFFLAFVMMQNTRFDAKIATMIPVIIMASIYATTGWLMTLMIFGIGLLLYLALGKLINK